MEKNNETLTHKLNQRLDTQEKRVEAIIEIALAERENLFNDVDSLFRNTDRFSLENLLNYSPEYWLSKRNKVLVKFIETLTQNEYSDNDLNQEKIFKRAIAVDIIYGACYSKYMSEINLAAASSIKYSLAHSKKIVNIDNHITSSGSYSRFLKWLGDLSKDQEPFLYLKDFYFLLLTMNKKDKKITLIVDVIYHTVTSFAAFTWLSSASSSN